MSSLSERIAIIGLGNPMRRDDGIGIRLLERLQERFREAPARFLDFGTASLGLVNTFREFDKVLLLDAVDAGLEPGTLRIFRLSDVKTVVQEEKLSSHEIALADLLRLCEAFGGAGHVHIAGVQVKDVSYGLQMTPELEAAQEEIVGQLVGFLSSWGLR
jgi:hydrogenase maturation protease